MIPLREIDLLGVFVSPFALCIPIALLGTAGAVALLRRRPARAAWMPTPLVELTLFTLALSALVLLLEPA